MITRKSFLAQEKVCGLSLFNFSSEHDFEWAFSFHSAVNSHNPPPNYYYYIQIIVCILVSLLDIYSPTPSLKLFVLPTLLDINKHLNSSLPFCSFPSSSHKQSQTFVEPLALICQGLARMLDSKMLFDT